MLTIFIACSPTDPGAANDAPGEPAGSAAASAEGISLEGTTWQLVEIHSMDDQVYTPDEPGKYTLAFDRDGGLRVQADCNRGHATWKQDGPSGLSFGPMATTRAECPPGSLYARFLGDLAHVRSFVRKDGDLYLATEADGAILEFEPAL